MGPEEIEYGKRLLLRKTRAQPMPPAPRPPAPHVQAAVQRTGGRTPSPPAVAQAHPVAGARPPAAHVQAALQAHAAVQRKAAELAPKPVSAPAAQAPGYVVYTDLKSPTSPPPPPRWPVYALHCPDKGPCTLRDVRTGRVTEAGTVYAGFVRMAAGGEVYISPRPDLGVPGDSHPTIASGTPEGMAGKRALVAAGEIGIIDGQIVGHNDKTGHYQTRKNRWQSGLPEDKYHPFTIDPREWFKKPRKG